MSKSGTDKQPTQDRKPKASDRKAKASNSEPVYGILPVGEPVNIVPPRKFSTNTPVSESTRQPDKGSGGDNQ